MIKREFFIDRPPRRSNRRSAMMLTTSSRRAPRNISESAEAILNDGVAHRTRRHARAVRVHLNRQLPAGGFDGDRTRARANLNVFANVSADVARAAVEGREDRSDERA